MPWNLQVDEHPAAVAYPADPHEVARIVRAAAASGLRVAPQGTGHGAPPLAGRLGDAVLLRTSAMTGLRVDAAQPYGARRAPACSGATSSTGPAGSGWRRCTCPARAWAWSARRSAAGVSWYARQHGLQCSAITAVELVLADGTFVRATETQDARPAVGGARRRRRLRGRHRAGVRPAAGRARRTPGCWPGTGARPARPHRVGRVDRGRARVGDQRRPDLPGARRASGCPPTSAAGRLVMIDAVALGDAEAGARSSRRCGRCGPRSTPSRGARGRHRPPPARPRRSRPRSTPTASCVARPARRTRSRRWSRPPARARVSNLLFVELRQLGGALARPAPRGGALDHIDGSFLVLGVGLDVGTGWSAVREDATRVLDSLAALDVPGVVPLDGRRGRGPARLVGRVVRRGSSGSVAAADPDGLFVAPQRAGDD